MDTSITSIGHDLKSIIQTSIARNLRDAVDKAASMYASTALPQDATVDVDMKGMQWQSLMLARLGRLQEARELISGSQKVEGTDDVEWTQSTDSDQMNDAVLLFLQIYYDFEQAFPVDHLIDRALEDHPNDSYFHYLKALTIEEDIAERTEWLLQAIELDPLNLAAWMDLEDNVLCLTQFNHVTEALPDHWLSQLTIISLALRFGSDIVMDGVGKFRQLLPNWSHIQVLYAKALNIAGDKEKAHQVFASVPTDSDELIVAWSNSLFLHDTRSDLATLVSRLIQKDPDLTLFSTCYAVGQFHSAAGSHANAGLSFDRAQDLCESRLMRAECHILQGHERVEMSKPELAAASYRSALNESFGLDYRAWVGLARVYELVGAHGYALQYHERALKLCGRKERANLLNAYKDCFQSFRPGVIPPEIEIATWEELQVSVMFHERWLRAGATKGPKWNNNGKGRSSGSHTESVAIIGR